jgi:hypothetical protein
MGNENNRYRKGNEWPKNAMLRVILFQNDKGK